MLPHRVASHASVAKHPPSVATGDASDEVAVHEDSVTHRMRLTAMLGVQPKLMSAGSFSSKIAASEEQSPLLPHQRTHCVGEFLPAQCHRGSDDLATAPPVKSKSESRTVITNSRAPGPFPANLCVPVMSRLERPGLSAEKPIAEYPRIEQEHHAGGASDSRDSHQDDHRDDCRDSEDEDEEEFLTPQKPKRGASFSQKFSRNSSYRHSGSEHELDVSSATCKGGVCLDEARGFDKRIEYIEDPKLSGRPADYLQEESHLTPSEESEINDRHEIETNRDVEKLLEQVPELVAFRERKRQEYIQLCQHRRRLSALRASGTSQDPLWLGKLG